MHMEISWLSRDFCLKPVALLNIEVAAFWLSSKNMQNSIGILYSDKLVITGSSYIYSL